jgi:hypothetical protein
VLRLELNVETIYYLENPVEGIIKFATGSQLKYEDIVKEVFGVADINDLLMMLEYNKSFRESLCKAHEIVEEKITLDMIFRVASNDDLTQLKNNLLNEKNGDITIKE